MRLIDADALLEKLEMANECEHCPSRSNNPYFCGLSSELMEVCDEISNAPTIMEAKPGMKFMISNAPIIEAVPVVRCKDCKHKEDEALGMVYCSNFVGGWVTNNFFCAFGETMKEDRNGTV